MTQTRYTRHIDVGIFQNHVGFTLHFDQGVEHFLFDRTTARRLAASLFHVLEETSTPEPPRTLGISVAEDIVTKERLG
jgi:hypothetical protein